MNQSHSSVVRVRPCRSEISPYDVIVGMWWTTCDCPASRYSTVSIVTYGPEHSVKCPTASPPIMSLKLYAPNGIDPLALRRGRGRRRVGAADASLTMLPLRRRRRPRTG